MKRNIYLFVFIALFSSSCLEFDTEGDIVTKKEALNSADDLKAVLNSCYDEFTNIMNGTVQGAHELLGDHLAEPPSGAITEVTIFNRSTISFRTADRIIRDLYNCIYRLHVFTENLDLYADELNVSQLTAEAYFLRAYCHWELVKLWAQPYGYTENNNHPGVAIRLKSAYEVKERSTVAEVYAQIIKDLEYSLQNLPEENGVYADKEAALGLLSKVYFTMNDFEKTIQYSAQVLSNGIHYMADSLDFFTSNHMGEGIFISSSTSASTDNRSRVFTQGYQGLPPTMRPSRLAYDLFADTADARNAWLEIVDEGQPNESFLCNRFKKTFFNIPLVSATELALNHAEAALISENTDALNVAIQNINFIRKRAYGSSVADLDATTLTLEEIRKERTRELAFTGDRTTQLKRRGVLGESINIRGASWDCNGMVLQFPASDNTTNHGLNPEGGCN